MEAHLLRAPPCTWPPTPGCPLPLPLIPGVPLTCSLGMPAKRPRTRPQESTRFQGGICGCQQKAQPHTRQASRHCTAHQVRCRKGQGVRAPACLRRAGQCATFLTHMAASTAFMWRCAAPRRPWAAVEPASTAFEYAATAAWKSPMTKASLPSARAIEAAADAMLVSGETQAKRRQANELNVQWRAEGNICLFPRH